MKHLPDGRFRGPLVLLLLAASLCTLPVLSVQSKYVWQEDIAVTLRIQYPEQTLTSVRVPDTPDNSLPSAPEQPTGLTPPENTPAGEEPSGEGTPAAGPAPETTDVPGTADTTAEGGSVTDPVPPVQDGTVPEDVPAAGQGSPAADSTVPETDASTPHAGSGADPLPATESPPREGASPATQPEPPEIPAAENFDSDRSTGDTDPNGSPQTTDIGECSSLPAAE